MNHHYLTTAFSPSSIVIFGADKHNNTIANTIIDNLQQGGFNGAVHLIHNEDLENRNLPCHKDLAQINTPIDLAIIASPAKQVPEIISQCGDAGVKQVVIIGDASAKAIKQRLQGYPMHVLGPRSIGIMRPDINLNATLSNNHAKAGNIALVAQSGSMCSAILDWAAAQNVGFSSVITLGEEVDINAGDVFDFLALDAKTDSILLYIENLHHARSFMSGLRTAARMKPVIVLKASCYERRSNKADHKNTAITAQDAMNAALERAGAVRVNTVAQLFAAAKILSSGTRIESNRLLVIGNGCGPNAMACDHALDKGLRISELSPETEAALSEVLPEKWSKTNPIDLYCDASAERYKQAIEICLKESQADALLIMLTPQVLADITGTAQMLADIVTELRAKRIKKPILACWLGEEQAAAGRAILSAAKIPHFTTPDAAIKAFAYLTQYRNSQKMLLQVPPAVREQTTEPDIKGAKLILELVLAEGRRKLSTTESRAILSAFRIPVLQAILARSPSEALVIAESLSYPVSMKINSADISNKTEANGLLFHINSAQDIRSAYQSLLNNVQQFYPDAHADGVTVEPYQQSDSARELLIGVVRDPEFGPIIRFGGGGDNIDIFGDQAIALPPLNDYMIKKTICRTRISRALVASPHSPEINFPALWKVMQRVSEMVCELPEIVDMDINPLIVDEMGIVAGDARFTIDYPNDSRHYDHMAIHPYPSDLVTALQLPDGTNITIRPIRPEDAQMQQDFVRNLSQESRYMRFMQGLRELTPTMLMRLTQIDYDKEMAFLALVQQDDSIEQVGVVRYATNPDKVTGEFALAIADAFQNRGLGGILMQLIINHARSKNLKMLEGEVLTQNGSMLKLMQRMGFDSRFSPMDNSVVLVTRSLG